jgi:hypothetical protein
MDQNVQGRIGQADKAIFAASLIRQQSVLFQGGNRL